jgi:hypothetical protein
MAKKSIAQKLRDCLDASPAESNVPITSDEIGAVEAKKKREGRRQEALGKIRCEKKTEHEEIQKGQKEVETLTTPDSLKLPHRQRNNAKRLSCECGAAFAVIERTMAR